MELFKSKANAFLSSYYYPLLVLFATLISHTFSIEPLGFSIILVTAGTGLLICDDFRFIISPLIMFIFMFSDKSVKSGIFYTTPYLVAIGVVSFAVIFLLSRKSYFLQRRLGYNQRNLIGY